MAVEMRPCDAEDIRSLAMTEHPTAIVSWAHSSPGWTPERQERWRAEVIALVDVLRDNSVNADIDLHHSGMLIGRGSDRRRSSIRLGFSFGTQLELEGTVEGSQRANHRSRAAGEANALRSLWVANQTAFRNKLVLLSPCR